MGDQHASPLGTALRLLGAVVGVGALMSFVGGSILWIRFDALKLPADQVVNLLPKQLLLVVGAGSMAAPVAIGLLAALVFTLLNALDPEGDRRRLRRGLLALFAAISAIAAALLIDGADLPYELAVAAVVVLGGAVLLVAAALRDGHRYLPWVALAVWTLGGGAVAVLKTHSEPTMEPVAMILDGTPSGISGFYIGQTTDRLYVAPLPGTGDPGDPFADADVDRIMEIERDEVLQMTLRAPSGVDTAGAGRGQAQAMLEDLRVLASGAPSPPVEPVVTADPVTAFAPLVHLHSGERWWPMSAEAFLANAWLAWAHDDGCEHWTPSGDHVDDPSSDRAAKGRYDIARLAGARPYVHREADGSCADTGPGYTAAERTRLFDRDRARGLDQQEGFYLDLEDAFRKGTATVEHSGAQALLKGVPVYFERHPERFEGRNGIRITYWLFYGLSQPPGSDLVTERLTHEGDWERISVFLEPGRKEGSYLPISARYHAHDHNRDVPWSAVKRVGTGGSTDATHPVVYSARGSHASYWRAGSYENVFATGGRRRFAVYDEGRSCPECPQWRSWEALVDATVQPWYGFGGAWGDVGGDPGFTGPLGPSRHKSVGPPPEPGESLSVTTVENALTPVATPVAPPSTATQAAERSSATPTPPEELVTTPEP